LGNFWPTDVTPHNYWEFFFVKNVLFSQNAGKTSQFSVGKFLAHRTSILSAVYENVCPHSNYTYKFNTSVSMQINVNLNYTANGTVLITNTANKQKSLKK
jgi:hypothetical protein